MSRYQALDMNRWSQLKICFAILHSNQRPNNLVSDYELRQRRHCSLPERSYNPRQAPNEFYKFRSFSIKPNGCLINHGDVIAKRRASKSSSCSTTNTSRYSSDFLRKQQKFDEISQLIWLCKKSNQVEVFVKFVTSLEKVNFTQCYVAKCQFSMSLLNIFRL